MKPRPSSFATLTRFVAAVVFFAPACDRSAHSFGGGPQASPSNTTGPNASASASVTPTPTPPAPSASVSAAPSSLPPKTVVTFDSDAVGSPPSAFEPVVGDWYIAELSGAKGLKVDGGRWRNGQPSASLADQAKRLYGDRYAEFLDGVKAFAFFPFAVYTGDPPPPEVRISVRFYPEAGKIDQAAGIAFGMTPDGSYFGVRANALEDNFLYFRVVRGKRTILDTIRGVSTPTRVWHTLSVELRLRHLAAELDGRKVFDKTLDAAPSGRVGLWSKADSQVVFDDFKVEPLAAREAP
jgi:hypothetical protein